MYVTAAQPAAGIDGAQVMANDVMWRDVIRSANGVTKTNCIL